MRCIFAPLLGSKCCFSSVVEHFLGKEEVPSSILGNSSKQTMQKRRYPMDVVFFFVCGAVMGIMGVMRIMGIMGGLGEMKEQR